MARRAATSLRSKPTCGATFEWGATFVAVGSDLGLFRAATQALRDKFAAG
jgi:2-keto-3-deoxy-L-rhamnonate aldolase RhmA